MLVNVCVSVVPTNAPDGAVRDVPQAVPVDTATPAPGYTVGPVGPVGPVPPAVPALPVGPVGPATVDAAPVGPVGPPGPVGPLTPFTSARNNAAPLAKPVVPTPPEALNVTGNVQYEVGVAGFTLVGVPEIVHVW